MKYFAWKKIVAVASIFLFFVGTFVHAAEPKTAKDLVKEAKSQITEVVPKKVFDDWKAGKEFTFLDVRTAEEFAAGHLPKAVNIPRGLLEFKINKQFKDLNAPIVVYCRTGARGALATQTLKNMGYTNVTNMSKAFKGWSTAGYPVYNRHGEFVLKAFEKKE